MTKRFTVLTDTDLEIYHPESALGTRFQLSVTEGELEEWDTSNHDLMGISRPSSIGHGHICGESYAKDWQNMGGDRIGIILTPVP
jgi:hypothetical protein